MPKGGVAIKAAASIPISKNSLAWSAGYEIIPYRERSQWDFFPSMGALDTDCCAAGGLRGGNNHKLLCTMCACN